MTKLKILLIIVLFFFSVLITFQFTHSYLSDKETVSGNSIQAGIWSTTSPEIQPTEVLVPTPTREISLPGSTPALPTNLTPTTTPSVLPWINEIHYDNTSDDADEGVEIAGPGGFDLTGWMVVFYNGAGGSSYATLNLTGSIPNQQAGSGTLWFAKSGIQNGAPDGLALVAPGNNVIQFLSYEGSFQATSGPASGMTSTNIGVKEDNPVPPEGNSLQLQGAGNEYIDFTWAGPIASTSGLVNTGQTFN